MISPPGSPAVGWVQESEAGPSAGGFVCLEDGEFRQILGAGSLEEFRLDGGVEVVARDHEDDDDEIDNNGNRREERGDDDRVLIVKYDSLEAGIDLPLICISGHDDDGDTAGLGLGLDSSVASSIPQTKLPPLLSSSYSSR